jgi:hypothetical protein
VRQTNALALCLHLLRAVHVIAVLTRQLAKRAQTSVAWWSSEVKCRGVALGAAILHTSNDMADATRYGKRDAPWAVSRVLRPIAYASARVQFVDRPDLYAKPDPRPRPAAGRRGGVRPCRPICCEWTLVRTVLPCVANQGSG